MLPAAGRQGPPPPWPLPGAPLPDELDAWVALWATPQAVIWERGGCSRIVARYCRVMVRAEEPDTQAAILAQASILEAHLGLGPKAMRALLWTIADDEAPPPPRVGKSSARERIRAL